MRYYSLIGFFVAAQNIPWTDTITFSGQCPGPFQSSPPDEVIDYVVIYKVRMDQRAVFTYFSEVDDNATQYITLETSKTWTIKRFIYPFSIDECQVEEFLVFDRKAGIFRARRLLHDPYADDELRQCLPTDNMQVVVRWMTNIQVGIIWGCFQVDAARHDIAVYVLLAHQEFRRFDGDKTKWAKEMTRWRTAALKMLNFTSDLSNHLEVVPVSMKQRIFPLRNDTEGHHVYSVLDRHCRALECPLSVPLTLYYVLGASALVLALLLVKFIRKHWLSRDIF